MRRNTKQGLAQARDGRESIQRRGWGKKPEMRKTQTKARKELESKAKVSVRVMHSRACYRDPRLLDAK